MGIMTRYYFHARGPDRYIADIEGFEVPNVQAAYDIAVQTIRDIASDPIGFQTHADWAMEVTDDAGRTVFIVPFVLAPQ